MPPRVGAKKLYHGPNGRPSIKVTVNNCCGCGEVWVSDVEALELAEQLTRAVAERLEKNER